MIFTVPLQAGTTLANVVYRWIASGAIGAETATGVTQPWSTVPVFRIDSTPPAGAEEIVVYDSTDNTNWNAGGYRAGLDALASAQQVLLTQLWTPTLSAQTIVPGNPPSQSICRCYGTFNDLSAASADGLDVTFTLIAQDNTDPTIIYDLSSTPLKNTETGLLITDRIANATLTAGQITDINGNPYIDLNRTDYIVAGSATPLPAASSLKYLLESTALGATFGFSLLGLANAPTPVAFKLDTVTIGQTSSGTFDLAKNVVS